MKRTMISVFLALVMLFTLSGVVFANKPTEKGNMLPMGEKTYNFNVIGVPCQKNWDPDSFNTGGNGKRIFILRDRTTSFYVYGDENGTFAIQDRDGTDGKVGKPGLGIDNAGIVLPYDSSGEQWDCQVFARLLGPVDSSFDWSSFYWDEEENAGAGGYVPITPTFTLDRNTKFAMKNSNILKDGYQDILWEWDNKKTFRICQFRIVVGAPE